MQCSDCERSTSGRCNIHLQPALITVTLPPTQTFPQLWIQQGWQCPRCKRIYAPFMLECSHCNVEVGFTAPTGWTGSELPGVIAPGGEEAIRRSADAPGTAAGQTGSDSDG